MSTPAFLGIDIGTSGIRASCIDADAKELLNHRLAFDSTSTGISETGVNQQDPANWLKLLDKLLLQTTEKLAELSPGFQVAAIAIDGTSSTIIACNKDGDPLSPALMYNDRQSQLQAEQISRFAPADSAVHGASSSLAKALNLLARYPQTELLCHQADWLAASLTGKYGVSDENNCLKLGYDSIRQCWPDWLQHNSENVIVPARVLPEVHPAGRVMANIKPELVRRYQLADNCILVAGTTDSNAAVLATGAGELGDAVTSLGSTLVVKLFTDKPVFNPDYGIYSHHLNGHWLVGGASNTGGAVLLQHFTAQQMDEMSPQLRPQQPTALDYYPLPATGERFPRNDANKKSKISPRPDDEITFFQALLEGIAGIEAEAYDKLETLASTPVKRIFTAGGGSKNPAWAKIRERTTGTTILPAIHSEASYGSALLALKGASL